MSMSAFIFLLRDAYECMGRGNIYVPTSVIRGIKLLCMHNCIVFVNIGM